MKTLEETVPGEWRSLPAVFLVSAGVLAFEVLLTRVFSLTYWHHFAGLLISLALIGFGTAGSLLTLALPFLGNRRPLALVVTASGAALAMPLVYRAVLIVELEPLALAWSRTAWLDLALVCLILVVPFLLAAAHIGLLLAWAKSPGRVYAANLAGSALGCLLAALALSYLPPHQAIYPAAGLCLLGGVFAGYGHRHLIWIWAGIPLGLTVLAILQPLPLRFEPFKDRSAVLAAKGSRLESQVVGLHGLVEVIAGPAFHFAPGLALNCTAPLPAQAGLFVDGDLIGPITRFDPDGPIPEFIKCLLIHLPLAIQLPKRILVINPNGGLSLLAAVETGAEVVGVEDNPQIFQLLTGPWSEFSGRIYLHPRVKVIRADPAIYLEKLEDQFDVIIFGHGGRWEAGSGLDITRLLTVEEQRGILGHLTEQGILIWSGPLDTPPRAPLKLMATAAEALRASGREPRSSLAVIRDWNTVLILIKPAGFTSLERERIKSAADHSGFDLSVLPGLKPEETNRYHVLPDEPLYQAGEYLLDQKSEAFYQQSLFNLRPATRDRPYFFHFFSRRTLPLILDPRHGQPLAASEWGLLFTWGGLAAALILAAGGILLPLIRMRPCPGGLPFFALIGLGYMLAEISLLSETIYVIGRPYLAIPLVIGVFLFTSGLGCRWWGSRPPRKFTYLSAAALPLALLGLRYLPSGAITAGLSLIPAALVMGAPFAGGLAHIIGPEPTARAWAFGVNGFFSVVGSLAAGLLCLEAGHFITIFAAAGCYLLAGLSTKGGGS